MAIDNTALDVIIPEVWGSEMLDAMYDTGKIINRVDRVDGDVKAMGDILHLPAMPSLTIADVTASSGAVSDEDVTPTEIQLTINKWRHNTISIVDKADIQAKLSILDGWRKAAGPSLGQDIESTLLALYSDVTTNVVGDASSTFGEDLATLAIGKLMDTKFAPALDDPNRVTFALHSGLWKVAKKVSQWSDAQITGDAKGGSRTFNVPAIYGVPIVFSTQVANSGGAEAYRGNMLFLREALALGIQREIQVKELVNTGYARRFSANVLFGVKTRAETRAVLIKTKA